MSSGEFTQSHDSRPRALHTSRSFTRMDSPSSNPSSPRKRANTTQVSGIASIPEARSIDASPELFGKDSKADVFENRHDEEDDGSETEMATPELNLPSTLDELPIEIRSMTERFLDSLSAKVHPAPLSAETLSDMFQDFYERAASQISIHIATLASRLGRKDSSPTATMRSSKGRARAGSTVKRNESPSSTTSGGEMLTVSEVSDRKKARKQLELKRIALEEAVERAVCERIYDKLWKHRTTDDDARDEKLRSRTAALSLVGIGLKELHVDIEPSEGPEPKTVAEKEAEIHSSLAPAREALERMDDERYPLGKLSHLTVAHKSIVETLSQLFPSSSSADEILPTLIYTLITSSDLDLNVVSNLNFIQRFRASSKVDGESAYCLVNLEASISFLETVDLSSLRADEQPEGPAKSSSRPSTPSTDKTAPAQPAVNRSLKPETTAVSALSHDKSTPDTTNKPLPSTVPSSRPGAPHRRLSSMVQAQADRFEASRENLLQAADKVYDSINGTLENSLASLFGRLKDQVPNNNPIMPKTLEEARKLVSTPPAATPEDEYPPSITLSGRSSPAGGDDPLTTSNDPPSSQKPAPTSRPLELLAGRRPPRDRSADSTSSTTSGSKRAPFPSTRSPQPPHAGTKPPAAAATDEPLNAAANFITAINPLNRFASAVPSFPRFGRAASTGASTPSPQPPSTAQPPPPQKETHADATSELEKTRSRVSEGGSDLNAIEALAELRRIKPPRRRFLEVQGAGELRLGEVEELLAEYRRLAKAIGEAVAQ